MSWGVIGTTPVDIIIILRLHYYLYYQGLDWVSCLAMQKSTGGQWGVFMMNE